jgi:hypothetical protein
MHTLSQHFPLLVLSLTHARAYTHTHMYLSDTHTRKHTHTHTHTHNGGHVAKHSHESSSSQLCLHVVGARCQTQRGTCCWGTASRCQLVLTCYNVSSIDGVLTVIAGVLCFALSVLPCRGPCCHGCTGPYTAARALTCPGAKPNPKP